jgi:hypothetical protein
MQIKIFRSIILQQLSRIGQKEQKGVIELKNFVNIPFNSNNLGRKEHGETIVDIIANGKILNIGTLFTIHDVINCRNYRIKIFQCLGKLLLFSI